MADAPGSRRRRLIAGGAALCVLLAVDTVVWTLACHRLDDGAREAAATTGWLLDAAPARWGGWPLAAEVIMQDAVLRTGPDLVPPLTWTVPRLVLRLSAWSPTQVTASASGSQSLAVGAARPTPFTASSLTAAIDLTAHAAPRITAADLAIDDTVGPVRISAAALMLPPGGWSAQLRGVTFPGRDSRPINPAIESLQLDGRIAPPIEPMPTATQSAQAWRAAKGQLALELVGLRWGALAATARATLTLDAALQPVVTGTITASGLPATIAQLAENGAITSASSTAAQAMLVILAAPVGGGPITLPLEIQDGTVSVARFPLLRLAPLQWD